MELKIRDWTVTGTPAEIWEIIKLSEGYDRKAEQPAPAPKLSRKKEFDVGKAKALRDAGWSYAKIADEMHVSDMTVAARLKELQEGGNADENHKAREDETESVSF